MFSIFKGVQLDSVRDKGALFFVLVFPILLVAILGITLGNLDNPDETIDPLQIAYLVEDSDDGASEILAEATAEAFADVEQINLFITNDLQAARDRLAAGELDSLVVFTADAEIEIYEGNNSIQNRAVRTIFEGVTRMQTVSIVAMDEIAAQMTAAAIGVSSAQGTELTPAVSDFSSDFDFSDLPVRVEEQTFGVTRTMIDYYAITMIVMMFFMSSAVSGASMFYEARKNRTLSRVLASPQSRASLYLQYVAGNVPFNIIQVLMVMVFATLFLGAHYAATPLANLLLFAMLFAAGMAASSLFMVLGIFLRKINPFMLLMPIMWVILFLSGTFSKEVFVPGVSDYLPPALIQSAAFDLTLFGHMDKSVIVLVVSVVLVVASTIVGTILFNRKAVTQ